MTDEVPPGRRILPPVYFLLALLVQAALHYFFPVAQLIGSPLRLAGLILVIASIVLVVWGATLFRRTGTAIKPFEQSTALVTTGPYRFTRNPMYLGLTGTLLGIALLLGSLSPLPVVPAFAALINARFIRAEEAMLERTFGQPYLDYRSRVRRWL